MKILTWLAARLKERSTYLGLTAILTAVGLSVQPDLVEAIIPLGMGIGGLIAFVTKDKTPPSA